MTNRRLLSSLAAVLCLLVGVGPLLLATPSTPQTSQQRRQNELERRQINGDVAAIWELYRGGFYPSRESNAYLALEGAVLGDREFQKIYFDYFLQDVKPELRAERLRSYRMTLSGPQTTCFLDMLQREAFSEACTAATTAR